MKKIRLLLIGLLAVTLIISCGESESVTKPVEEKDYSEEVLKFFPVKVGDSFNYSIDTLDNNSGHYSNIGTRQLNVFQEEKVGDKNDVVCKEEYNVLGKDYLTESKFYLTSNSIEFTVDTSGVSALIPDSLEINLVLDESFLVVKFPLVKNEEWTVFRGSANFGTFKFNVFEIYGEYLESETLQLDGSETNLETEKFKYTLNLNIPDIENPFISEVRKFNTYVWFAPGYGIAKVEGSLLFINPITGNGLDIADTNRVVRHTLVSN